MEKFVKLLGEQFDWPCVYTFKFIIPATKLKDLEEILPLVKCEMKESKNGKYVSLSLMQTMGSPEQVLKLYEEVQQAVPEVIGL